MTVSIRKLIENEVARAESAKPGVMVTNYARGMIDGLTLAAALNYPDSDSFIARLDAVDALSIKKLRESIPQ
ncbi:MAG: hypothetical protein EXR84_14035 [Gammaproteobacteria bacterium]|nr:hypothetical protein [Gammaproteobacteria bacterium]